MKDITQPQPLHIPVLLSQVIQLLAPQKGESYLDLTAGYGGHASRVIDMIGSAKLATLVDRDEMAINALEPLGQRGATLDRNDFASAASQYAEAGKHFDMILVDLGVSSPQLDRAERGFSIQHDGPLDMRMDNRQDKTAADIVNRASEREITDIITRYGEERPAQAARIARAVIRARPIATTRELATVIASTFRGPRAKVHPSTRTFQAIRIALNDELGQVEKLLPILPRLLKPGGRVAIISFHSLEDRLVKQYFAEQSASGYEAELRLLTPKGVKGATEDVYNPRARSAVLRAAAKIKTKGLENATTHYSR